MSNNDKIQIIDSGSLHPMFVKEKVFIISSDIGVKERAKMRKIWTMHENNINKLAEIGKLFTSEAFDYSLGFYEF